MRTLIENRSLLSVAISCLIGIVLFRRFPFPEEHPPLELVRLHWPYIFWAIRNAYVAMLFTMPLIGASMFFSLLYIFVVRQKKSVAGNRLPLYPDPRLRQSLFLVVGEMHNPKDPSPSSIRDDSRFPTADSTLASPSSGPRRRQNQLLHVSLRRADLRHQVCPSRTPRQRTRSGSQRRFLL